MKIIKIEQGYDEYRDGPEPETEIYNSLKDFWSSLHDDDKESLAQTLIKIPIKKPDESTVNVSNVRINGRSVNDFGKPQSYWAHSTQKDLTMTVDFTEDQIKENFPKLYTKIKNIQKENKEKEEARIATLEANKVKKAEKALERAKKKLEEAKIKEKK